MTKLYRKNELMRWESTRDTRDRLDLITACEEAIMAKLYRKHELVNWDSTRDTRHRLDLITRDGYVGPGPVRARHFCADRILTHPGDLSANMYFVSTKVFYFTEGDGLLMHVGGQDYRFSAGDVLIVPAGEAQQLDHDGQEDAALVEFFCPPPIEAVWADPADR